MESNYREYTLSEEFLVNQYQREFVKELNASMKQAVKEYSAPRLLAMCVPLGIMYGVFLQRDEEIEDNMFFKTKEGKEFWEFFQEHIDYKEAEKYAMERENLCYHMAARVYRPLAQAYLADYVKRDKDTEWKLWDEMTHSPVWYPECKITLAFPEYSWSDYLQDEMIQNDGCFYRMLEVLIRTSKEIRLDHMMRMNQWIHLENLKHSVQGTLVKGLIEAVEETTHRKLEILAGMHSYIKTIEDFKQAVEGSVDSEFCREMLVKAMRNPEFFQVRREKEFTDFLLEFLSEKENVIALWYILYEYYYFIPEPTEQERKVQCFVNSFDVFVELYWNLVKEQYSEVD